MHEGSSPSGRGWILTRGAGGGGPSVWTGLGLSQQASPGAPHAGGERGLPKLLVLSSATRPVRGRLLKPSPTSLKFLRPSKRKKRKKKRKQIHSVTCF